MKVLFLLTISLLSVFVTRQLIPAILIGLVRPAAWQELVGGKALQVFLFKSEFLEKYQIKEKKIEKYSSTFITFPLRFILGLRGSASRMHILPYLKILDFWPVKFRIQFQIIL